MNHPSPLRLLPLVLATLATPAPAQQRGELYQRVVDVLAESYYDDAFRARELPELARRYAPAARAAETLDEERGVVHELLARIPVSHLGLLSTAGRDAMWSELRGAQRWMLGCQLVRLEEGWFLDWVYEGGPADRAGLARGDEVLTIDGVPPERSPRLDWRTDDSALPDPPIHALLTEEGDVVDLHVRRRRGLEGRVSLPALPYSGWEASRRSVAVHELGPFRIGYVHYWFIPLSGGARFLRELCEERFADCDALVFDLRGRGGAGHEALRIVSDLDAESGSWRRPLVLLVDSATRSAKEVISFELQRRGSALVVGEKTPGAVIPATFRDVGFDTVLMFPAFTLGSYTEHVEGKGVTPDVHAEYPLAWSEGADPVLEAGLAAARAWCEEASPAVHR